MHELSIALRILDAVSEEAERLGQIPCAVHVRIGTLTGIVKEALVSAYTLARDGSEFAQTELVIDDVDTIGWCPQCQAEQPVKSSYELCCRACGGSFSRIVSGQELELVGLEVIE